MSERTKSYRLIAKTDGKSYSIFVRETGRWQHTTPKMERPYTPFKGYVPHHMKNFKRGCKFMLEINWPSFRRPDIS